MHVAFNDIYIHPLPENHRFPMEKYGLLVQQLLHEGTISEQQLFSPKTIDRLDVEAVHDKAYFSNLLAINIPPKQQRVTGFVHSNQLIEREMMIMGGTKECAERVVKGGVAMNIAGGTHHAFTDRGEGFCLLNDQVIAASWLQRNTKIQKILIVDLDVHQGNGTAEMLASNDDVFTFSMHGAQNYPLKKERSNLDVGLPDACDDRVYLFELQKSLDQILTHFTPEFVFYQCGVDVVATDKLGRLALSKKGCADRDAIVFETVRQMNLPVVCTMGGGYSPHIRDIIEAHANTYRMAQKFLL